MDHDPLFKELLTPLFVEFVGLFFPELVQDLDRESLEVLDKEVFTDVTEGERREVDLVRSFWAGTIAPELYRSAMSHAVVACRVLGRVSIRGMILAAGSTPLSRTSTSVGREREFGKTNGIGSCGNSIDFVVPRPQKSKSEHLSFRR
jgi:hypothetical protein